MGLHFCPECGRDWDVHRRSKYHYICPEPPEGRWVGHWPEG